MVANGVSFFGRLTGVQALEKIIQRVFRLLNATLDDGVLPLDFALGQPSRQLLDALWVFWDIVKNNETLHAVLIVSTGSMRDRSVWVSLTAAAWSSLDPGSKSSVSISRTIITLHRTSYVERLQRLSLASVISADGPALNDAAPELGLAEGKIENLAAD